MNFIKSIALPVLLLGGVMGLTPAAFAQPVQAGAVQAAKVQATKVQAFAAATVERQGADSLRVSWSGLTAPVKLILLDTPDATKGRQLVTVATGSETLLPLARTPRPYLLLRDAKGQDLRVAERLLPLEGGQNFRDLGGYRTSDGRNVRWGRLYRSGSMAELTTGDFGYLGSLDIRTVCDFRSTEERTSQPVNWPASDSPKVLAKDYTMDLGGFMQAFRGKDLTEQQAREMMAGFYGDTAFRFAEQYRRMFAELLAGQAPLTFNCSAGKDRTGVAAALLLSALGVPRETVIADYLLSNQYYKPRAPKNNVSDPSMAALSKMPPEVLRALMGVDRSYLEKAFAAIESRPGGLQAYFRDDMGLSNQDIVRLRGMLLQ